MELLIILLIIIIALLAVMLRKLLDKLNEISVKIAKYPYPTYKDEEGHIETARPIGDNLESLRDDIGNITENLYRIMDKYGIESRDMRTDAIMDEIKEKHKKREIKQKNE